MRLWSLHPNHLDAQGLVALWREGLLALHVLDGRTRGYRHHPQLARFRASPEPLSAITAYLQVVVEEAACRGYRFDVSKLPPSAPAAPLAVTSGQLALEWTHLLAKLEKRSPSIHAVQVALMRPRVHPLFLVIEGQVEAWERASAPRAPPVTAGD